MTEMSRESGGGRSEEPGIRDRMEGKAGRDPKGGKAEVGRGAVLTFLEYSRSVSLSRSVLAPLTLLLPLPRQSPPARSGSLGAAMLVVLRLCGKWILFHYGNKLLLPSEQRANGALGLLEPNFLRLMGPPSSAACTNPLLITARHWLNAP